MATLLIDLGIVGIVVFCAWRGFRNGLIRGAFGIVTLIVSLFLANIIARAYAEEFTGVLTPFASGIVESTLFGLNDFNEELMLNLDNVDLDDADISNIDLHNLDLSSLDLSALDLGDYDIEDFDLTAFELDNFSIGALDSVPDKFMAAFLALKFLGMTDAAAAQIAHAASIDISGNFFPVVVGDNLSLYLSFIALFSISFLLIAIVFTVIGNLIGVIFTLPGLQIIDGVTGVAFGFVKGMIIVLVIGVVVRYFAFLPIINNYVYGSTVLQHIANNNMLANLLGV